MVEPYKSNLIPDHWQTAPRRTIKGKLVAISGLRLKQRDTWLIHPRTRVFSKYSIAELTVTDEKSVNPGSNINSVLYIGFLEIQKGGVVIAGDIVALDGREIGNVRGFSDIHVPNHINIMVEGNREYLDKFVTPYQNSSIVDLELKIEDDVSFRRNSKISKIE
ncbi:MAG: DUF6917 domain-containing protein [Candidatus Hodarchaeales archaeon]